MKTILILAVLAVACADDNPTTAPDEKQPQKQQPRVVPNYVTVEHILIAVANPRMPKVKRTPQEAAQIVEDIRDQLDDGADFEKLKQQHSDDRGPTGRASGPYDMANRG
ncbi:MAG: peptidylprolyl isomerase, partial [Planctomycetota bacterium]